MEDYTSDHFCQSDERYNFECYLWEDGKLHLSANGEYETTVKYCPFCGFKAPSKTKSLFKKLLKRKE